MNETVDSIKVPSPEKYIAIQLEDKCQTGKALEYEDHFKSWFREYLDKIILKPKRTIKRPPIKARFLPAFISFVGAFIGLIVLSTIHYKVVIPLNDSFNTSHSLFIYSFGATAVLLYDLPEAPAIQPRNMLGNVLSAIIGVTIRFALFDFPYLSGPLAAALSIAAMRLTYTMHPPGGATALIAVLSNGIPSGFLAYFFVLMPVLLAYIWLFVWGILLNNLSADRQYPHVWW